jgi:hypothetical protein
LSQILVFLQQYPFAGSCAFKDGVIGRAAGYLANSYNVMSIGTKRTYGRGSCPPTHDQHSYDGAVQSIAMMCRAK